MAGTFCSNLLYGLLKVFTAALRVLKIAILVIVLGAFASMIWVGGQYALTIIQNNIL